MIFVTASDQFAVAAFDVAAVDYLLKPVDAQRLERAVARIRTQTGTAAERIPATASPWTREFWVPHRMGVIRIATERHRLDRSRTRLEDMLHTGPRRFPARNHHRTGAKAGPGGEFVRLHPFHPLVSRRDCIVGFKHNGFGNLGGPSCGTDVGCASAVPILPTPAPWPPPK